jgi:ribosomal-protein-alanine N-acetyltransferase
MTYGKWPVVLKSNEITLRPLRFRDHSKWDDVRAANRDWLAPWEATRPLVPGDSDSFELPSFYQMVAFHNREGRARRSSSLAVWYQGSLVGQITMGGIVMGALRGAHIGYWVDRRFANLGITTRAVVMMTEYGFHELGLHRIEINLRPENGASLRVAEKAGYHFEGERPRFLHIDGNWRDHLCFVQENPKII